MVLKTVKIPVFFIGKALEDSLSRSCSFSLMKQQKWEFYPKRRNRGLVSVSPCQHGGEPDDEELSLTTPYNSDRGNQTTVLHNKNKNSNNNNESFRLHGVFHSCNRLEHWREAFLLWGTHAASRLD